MWYLNSADELMAQLEELKQSGDDAKIQEWLNEKKSEVEDGVKASGSPGCIPLKLY